MYKVLLVFLCIMLTTTSYSQKFKVVEDSRLAKIAGRLKGEKDKYAITIGKTIFLNCKAEVFFSDPPGSEKKNFRFAIEKNCFTDCF